MAKKKKTKRLAEGLEVAKDLKEFASGQWKGLAKYECPHCKFDSVNPDLFRSHIRGHRPPKPKTTAGLLDASGNPIKKEETDNEEEE